jgi:AraC-like DNA-binding protein
VSLADTAHGAPYFANSMRVRAGARWRRIDYCEIMAVAKGEGRLIDHRGPGIPRVEPLLPGTIFMLRPFDDPHITGAGEDGMFVHYVSFPASAWRAYADLVGIGHSWLSVSEMPRSTFDADAASAIEPFARIRDRFRQNPTVLDLVRFWTDVLPMLFGDEPAHIRGLGAPNWLLEGLEAMHLEENLRAGVPRLLRLTHVTSSYLATVTRRFFDATPTALVSEIRLRHAALLLSSTNESIAEIARRCGFTRINYFSNSFRRAYDVSAREYRARAQGRRD